MGNTSISSGSGGGAFDADGNTLITPSTPIVLGQATGDEAALTLDYTTNKATSGDDTGLLINQTDTASPGTSKLLDLQVGGSSKFNVTSGSGGAQLIGTSGYSVALYGGATSALYSLNLIGKLGFSYNAGPYLIRDAAGTLAQRNGVEAQTYNIYNSYTSATDYERAHIGWNDTADTFVIGTEAAGTGVDRAIQLKPASGAVSINQPADDTGMQINGFDDVSNRYLKLGVLPNGRAIIKASIGTAHVNCALLPTGTHNLGGNAEEWNHGFFKGLIANQGTLTDDAQALNITSTWNDAADTFTLIKADVTDTASAAGSKLLDLQVGGASKLSVDATGRLHFASVLENNAGDGWYFVGGGTTQMRMDASTGLQIPRTYSLAWSDSDNASTGIKDLFIRRDAPNTLAQRNGVNAQTFNLYNTYTSATSYERGFLKWDADTFVIGTEAGSGGGTVRDVTLRRDANTLLSLYQHLALLRVGPSANHFFRFDSLGFRPNQWDNGFDLGTAAYRFRDLHLGRNLHVGGSVGFNGVTPPAQAAHIADATDATDVITRVNAILVALENIGITAAS